MNIPYSILSAFLAGRRFALSQLELQLKAYVCACLTIHVLHNTTEVNIMEMGHLFANRG